MEITSEMVEPPERWRNAAGLLAQRGASGITGTIQRSLSSREVSLSLLHQRLVWPAAVPETELALR
jgi:hypothetical protein